MLSCRNAAIFGGTFIDNSRRGYSRQGFDVLHEHIAPGAFHDSSERFSPPRCYRNTREAALQIIIDWIEECDPMFPFLWVHGPAGGGKSAIAQTIAEWLQDHEHHILIASFFFARSAQSRSSEKQLIPTIAYQLALSIPLTRRHIEEAVENDPSVFDRSLETQIQKLIVRPLQLASLLRPSLPLSHDHRWSTVIIIDGLDECNDPKMQIHILQVLCGLVRQTTSLTIQFLITSRSEHHLRTYFDSGEISRLSQRLLLDDYFHPDTDIRLFLRGKFDHIKQHHPFKSHISESWPSDSDLGLIVQKSLGQFIFASTALKYVESVNNNPVERLQVICGRSPSPNRDTPFDELDRVYLSTLATVKDIDSLLYIMRMKVIEATFYTNNIADTINPPLSDRGADHEKQWGFAQFLSLGEDHLRYYLADLDSVLLQISDDGSEFSFLHGSFLDFLQDRARCGRFFVDMEKAHADAAICFMKHLSRLDGPSMLSAKLWRCLSYHMRSASPTTDLHDVLLIFNAGKAALQVPGTVFFELLTMDEGISEFLCSIKHSRFLDRDTLNQHVAMQIDPFYRAHLSARTPLNLFDLRPIMTLPEISRHLQSLLTLVLPRYLRSS
ncbi:hypothetical protein B0H34DRAFT_454799 [Crassisporium funariophilum]|nr:hypothetical protein B0H34DRAFT_454799 [Crassisporium funariophilum]